VQMCGNCRNTMLREKIISKVVTEMQCGTVRNVDMTHTDLI
jgi:hypothetical protein